VTPARQRILTHRKWKRDLAAKRERERPMPVRRYRGRPALDPFVTIEDAMPGFLSGWAALQGRIARIAGLAIG